MMEVLAIIPARGGSKGIPKKNIQKLFGKPLIEYTFDAIKESRLITRSLISTDDDEIASVGIKNGIAVSKRPAHLAGDNTVMTDVIDYHLASLEDEGYKPDIFILLQPTSPLRSGRHIDEALSMIMSDDRPTADAVVSVVTVPHSFLPMKLMELSDDGFLNFYEEGGEKYTTRQTLPRLYARNGAAVYAVKTDAYKRTHSLYGNHCVPYLMREDESVDIDEPDDMLMAMFMMLKREMMKNRE